MFQSTRPRGGATTRQKTRASVSRFQSTRPRGARPSGQARVRFHCLVSIHAPAGGATSIFGRGSSNGRFQSTRPRGARRLSFQRQFCNCPFQSTRPRGARRQDENFTPKISKVSIHAPAGGATNLDKRGLRLLGGFNPRARGGRDASLVDTILRTFGFQSTRPRGARLQNCNRFIMISVSIHAPAGGATKRKLTNEKQTKFQSTRPRGARLEKLSLTLFISGFNPRARGGRDRQLGQN